jgi:hypothetical protein
MENILWFIVVIISILANAYQLKLHYKEKKDIFVKFMARNLAESEYFDKIYPGIAKNKLEEMRKAAKKTMTEAEKKVKEIASKF